MGEAIKQFVYPDESWHHIAGRRFGGFGVVIGLNPSCWVIGLQWWPERGKPDGGAFHFGPCMIGWGRIENHTAKKEPGA